MLFIFILLSVAACFSAAGTAVFVIAIINAVIAFWANGVLANFRSDPQNAPDAAALLSMLTILGSIGIGIAGLALR